MVNTRIKDLTNDTTPSASDYVAIDADVGGTRNTNLTDLVNAARPFASEAEAIAGSDATKAMNPLATKQAIEAIGASNFATVAQGAKADTAVQPGDISTVATTGDYDDLTNKPTLGTAAAEDTSAFATAAQGTLADSSLQPSDIGTTVQARDALLDSVSGLSLTAGDLLVADGAASVTNLAKGAEGQVLSVSAGAVAWRNETSASSVSYNPQALTASEQAQARKNITVGTHVPTRTVLKALDTAKDTVAYLSEAGREGQFVWKSGDFSAQVAADTQEGVYIEADAVAASSGAWVRQYSGDVVATWFGAVGDNATDNEVAFEAWFAFLMEYGGRGYIPEGDYRVAGTVKALVTSGKHVPHFHGAGPHVTTIYSTAGASTSCFDLEAVSDISISNVSFDKPVRDQLGYGLVIRRCAWAHIENVTSQGFQRGLFLQNVLTLTLISCKARWNETGLFAQQLAGQPFVSPPNALTLIGNEFGLNTLWGAQIYEPKVLNILGGAIEGNGTAGGGFNGGIYISNPSTTCNISTYFEQNNGSADIHISKTDLADDLVVNVHGCNFIAIGMTNIVTNRIYLAGNKKYAANVWGNWFGSKGGGYTPDAGRPYIAIQQPIHGTVVNTNGDTAQFTNATETPNIAAWGGSVARGLIASARAEVANSGSASLVGTAYNVDSVTRTGPGVVTVSFDRNMATSQYLPMATSLDDGIVATARARTVGNVEIVTTDATGTQVDADFGLVVFGGLTSLGV